MSSHSNQQLLVNIVHDRDRRIAPNGAASTPQKAGPKTQTPLKQEDINKALTDLEWNWD